MTMYMYILFRGEIIQFLFKIFTRSLSTCNIRFKLYAIHDSIISMNLLVKWNSIVRVAFKIQK